MTDLSNMEECPNCLGDGDIQDGEGHWDTCEWCGGDGLVTRRSTPPSTENPGGYRRRNDDALYNRPAEPGSPTYDYMHRYDSPDNERDSMG